MNILTLVSCFLPFGKSPSENPFGFLEYEPLIYQPTNQPPQRLKSLTLKKYTNDLAQKPIKTLKSWASADSSAGPTWILWVLSWWPLPGVSFHARKRHGRVGTLGHGLWHFDSGGVCRCAYFQLSYCYICHYMTHPKQNRDKLHCTASTWTIWKNNFKQRWGCFECDGDGRMQWCHTHEHRINITRTIPNACLLYNGYVPAEDCSSLPAAHVLETISYQKLIILNAHGCHNKSGSPYPNQSHHLQSH